MRVTIKVYKANNTRVCDLIREYKLCYVHGEMRNHLYQRASANKIALAWFNKEPVGAAMTVCNDNAIMVYVVSKFRNQGIGSRLVQKLPRRGKSGYIDSMSDRLRIHFWEKNDVVH